MILNRWKNSIKNGNSKQFITILYKKSLILTVKTISLAWTWIKLIIIAYVHYKQKIYSV